MLPRHENQLMSRLEQVVEIGCCTIRKHQLLVWYAKDEPTPEIWQDLQGRWQGLLQAGGEDTEVPLLAGEADGLWSFAWGEGLTTSEESWFKDVRELASAGG